MNQPAKEIISLLLNAKAVPCVWPGKPLAEPDSTSNFPRRSLSTLMRIMRSTVMVILAGGKVQLRA